MSSGVCSRCLQPELHQQESSCARFRRDRTTDNHRCPTEALILVGGDVGRDILSFLPDSSLGHCSRTCKMIHQLCDANFFKHRLKQQRTGFFALVELAGEGLICWATYYQMAVALSDMAAWEVKQTDAAQGILDKWLLRSTVAKRKEKMDLSYSAFGRDCVPDSSVGLNLTLGRLRLDLIPVTYFEICVLGQKSAVGVGIVSETFPVSTPYRFVGWQSPQGQSFAYHGDDGHKFAHSQSGEAYGPSYGVADKVGCGIDWELNSVFFTKNGCYLGTAFEVKEPQQLQKWSPAVGLVGGGDAIVINIGQDPFAYDFSKYHHDSRHDNSSDF